MNTAFPEVMAGTTTSTASPFLINAGLPYAANPNTHITSGVYLGDYYIRYNDNVTTGFESGYGSYNASTNELTVIAVYMSSTGDGVACDDFTSVAKHVGFTVAGSTLGNMARLSLNLPPHVDVRIGATGQSNLMALGLWEVPANAPTAVDDKIWHYAQLHTSQTDGSARSWQVLDPTQQVDSLGVDGPGPQTGFGRRVFNGSWLDTTNPAYQFARKLAALTGRRCRIINTSVSGQQIDDAEYGWGYDPSLATLTSTMFKTDVQAAIAALPADQTAYGDKLHFLIYHHGASDMQANAGNPSVSSAESFAYKLANYIEECYDPDKHDICDANTITMILAETQLLRRNNPTWAGWEMAADLIGSKAKFIPSPPILDGTWDGAHATAETADLYADTMLESMTTPASEPVQSGSGWRTYKNVSYYVDTYTVGLNANGTGAPVAAGGGYAGVRFSASSGAGTLRLGKSLGFFTTGGNIWEAGSKNWRKGDVIVFSKTNSITGPDRREVVIDSVGTDEGDYGLWDVTITTYGTLSTEDVLYVKSHTPLFNGEDVVNGTPAVIQSKKLAHLLESSENSLTTPLARVPVRECAKHRMLYAGPTGISLRHNSVMDAFWTFKTPNATITAANTYAFNGIASELWNCEHVTVEILVKRNSDGVTSRGTYTFMAKNLAWGATCLITEESKDIATAAYGNHNALALNASTFVAASTSSAGALLGNIGVWQLRFTGLAATDLSWTVRAKIMQSITTA